MNTRIVLMIILFTCFLSRMTFACNVLVDSVKVPTAKNVYNLYKQPTSCVDNLENLFESWPTSKISNAEDIELISYTSHGFIKDTIQIRYYAKLITQLNSPFLSTMGYSSGGHQGCNTVRLFAIGTYEQVLARVPVKDIRLAQKSLINELLTVQDFLVQTLQVGYRVFSIKFKYLEKEMETFIFCDPNSFEVVVDFIFKSMPL